jgi:sporulation protein YlmC with PRC-barrel domain
MLFSEAKGRRVVSISTAETLGQVDEFLVDPGRRAVVAIHLKKAKGGNTLLWPDILAFGADAVTVSGPEKIAQAAGDVALLAGKDHRLVGKRVLTTAGEELGEVADVDIDHEFGTVTSVLLHEGALEGERLVGVGSYAVVVKATATNREDGGPE